MFTRIALSSLLPYQFSSLSMNKQAETNRKRQCRQAKHVCNILNNSLLKKREPKIGSHIFKYSGFALRFRLKTPEGMVLLGIPTHDTHNHFSHIPATKYVNI